jgi:hypothetical protein
MYDPVVLRAKMHARKIEHARASFRKSISAGRAPYWKRPMRTAMSLSVAFAAGWLVATIF